jgi:rhomboid protease GluP
MLFTGVNALHPSSDQLISWGANYKPLTMYGESGNFQIWRILTSLFIHHGVLHLTVNLLALFQLGSRIENHIGKVNFIVLFLVCGCLGNIMSLWWNDYAVIGAGTSGALFGLIGTGLILYLVRIIELKNKEILLAFLTLFIGLNTLPHLFDHIDYSALAGGLIAGSIIGITSYLDYKKQKEENKNKLRFSIALSLILVSGYALWNSALSKKDIGVLYNTFSLLEETAIRGFHAEHDPDRYHRNVVQRYESCLEIANQMNQLRLSELLRERAELLKQYAEFRVRQTKLAEQYLRTENLAFKDSADAWDTLINKVTQRLQEHRTDLQK